MYETKATIGRLFLADLHTAETWLSGSPQDLKRAVRSYDRYLIYQDDREAAPPERYYQFLSCLKQCVFVEAAAMTPQEKEAHMLSKIFEWTSEQSLICFLAMGETGERLASQNTDREAVTSLTFRMGKFEREAAFLLSADGKEKTDPAVLIKNREEENGTKQKAVQETEKEPAASIPQAQTVESEGLPFAVVNAYEEPVAPKKKRKRKKKKTAGLRPEKQPEEHRESPEEPAQTETETREFISAPKGQQEAESEIKNVAETLPVPIPSKPEATESGHRKKESTDQKTSELADWAETPERKPVLSDIQERTDLIPAKPEEETLSDTAKAEEISVEAKAEETAGTNLEDTPVQSEENKPLQEQKKKQTEKAAQEGAEEPETSGLQDEAAKPESEPKQQKENGTDPAGSEKKKAGWKERISSKAPRERGYELQNLEDMIFATDRAAVRRDEPVPELVDTKAKTVSLYADRLIASIDRLLPKLAKRNVSRENYMEFISELVMSERVEDFQNGMAKLFSGFSVSIDAETYQQLRKQALHYAKTCQVLYGDDVWGI